MENYIVSARKYRPSTFASVVGQKALTATLKNAIATDRLAHAYLFCGSRGVGKTSCARIFAKAINCANLSADGEPCNECESCRSFNENRSLNIIELDAASNNGVEDIRKLVEQVQVPPTSGKYRVFIIDEVHMLSSAAFNAFLKTLEEPPSYVVFILATTEKQKIIPTILSRCQIYDFNRITVADMIDHLEYVAGQEGITTERAALNIIASKADGAMRDALSIFDQVAASSRGNITYASTIANLNVLDESYYCRLVEAFIAGDVTSSLLIYKEVRDHGFDSHFFINGLAAFMRDLMVARNPKSLDLLDTDADVKQRMAELASRCPVEFFYAAMSLCNEADLNYRNASSKRFLVELLLIRLCQQLSPSPTYSGDGEGQLKPLAATAHPAPATAPSQAPTPAQPVATAAPTPTPPVRPAVAMSTPPPPPPPAPAAAPTQQQARGQKVIMTAHQRMQQDAQRRNAQRPMATTTATTANRSNPYTDDDISRHWDGYAAQFTDQQVLTNTMRACRPKRTTGDTFNVMVENNLQMQLMHERLGSVLQYIHDAIGNDHINFTFSINTGGPAPKLWSDREVWEHLRKESEMFVKLSSELNLKLK
jgi:DNA polymerase-3 subunit gamma/tau